MIGWRNKRTGVIHAHAVHTGHDVRIVAATVLKPEDVDLWLQAPNPLLEGRSPIDVCAGGESDRVLAVLDALADGVIS